MSHEVIEESHGKAITNYRRTGLHSITQAGKYKLY